MHREAEQLRSDHFRDSRLQIANTLSCRPLRSTTEASPTNADKDDE
jgi:hypothetical protein